MSLRKEPRKSIAARAQVVWTDPDGAQHRANAMLEDISPGGASLRIATAFNPDAPVKVEWFREHFTGTVRHCRPSGIEFVLGILKDPAAPPPQEVDGDPSGD